MKNMDLNLDNLSNEELDTLLKDLEVLVRKTPLDYIPHEKQKQFHLSAKKIRILCGGNQSGKTTSGGLEAIYHATGLYPSWYPESSRINKANNGRIVVEDFKIFGEVVEKKMMEWLPSELLVDVKRGVSGNAQKMFIRHSSGGTSTITVMSYEQDDEAFEGWTGHWAWFDEPPPREKFIATLRGLMAFKGRCWLTLTPISEPWLYDEFISKPTDETFLLYVDILDNPHLAKEEIKIFESKLTEDEREARLHGRFKHLVGRVYKELDESVHCLSSNNFKIDRHWPVYFVLDPADRRPHHGIWARVDPYGTIYIVDEIVYKGTILELSKEILKRELVNGIAPLEVTRILDPNKGETPSAVSGLKLKDEFAKHAVYFLTNVNDDVTLGHLAVSERLSWDKSKPLSTTNHPKLFFIKENTTECIRQLMTYIWDDWRGKSKDDRSKKEKPKDINKDMPDCIRYLVVFNPMFYDAKGDEPIVVKPNSFTGYGY